MPATLIRSRAFCRVRPMMRKRCGRKSSRWCGPSNRTMGLLIFDDTIQAKPHTDENDLICWHYDHSQHRSVKGLNLLNCVYHAGGVSLPVTYELIRKPILFSDVKTRRVKRKSLVTKNEQMRAMLRVCQQNQLPYRYVLADSWFSAKDNLTFIHQTLHKHFVVALKSNRTVALSYAQKRQGAFSRIDACDLPEHQPVPGWIKGVDFPVLLLRQVFTNKDGSTGTLYLACSDRTCDGPTLEAIYHKRWNIETFHKTLKSHAALAQSPTKRERTRTRASSSNTLRAIRYAFDELQLLKAA